ncbi:sulfide/dihydroorotate dehydrogenase-like FAD/NAD-binding protein [Halanaerobacter jeridensis]|uniref:Ferredoxin--NADP+ reductase n=1 Tax=Halanaerobacter jeridensis TaxID=706427 RepID=A0A938XUP2_9FIRM|nr:ferredoxin--NADP+ reductase [Halanaerobacter jeridensis]
MYEIVEKNKLAPEIFHFEVKAPEIAAKAQAGHFLILRAVEKAERIPLTIADYDREQGTIDIVVQEVGYSSQQICDFEEGEAFLDVVAPLGNPIETEDYDRVICVAGGLGAAPLYPKVKSLVDHGAEVTTILGAQRAEKLIWEDRFADLSEDLYIATDDGSRGTEGFVTNVLEELLSEDNDYDAVIAIGPMIMMQAVSDLTAEYDLKTIVSLNTLMVDGTGMCGGCRVTVGEETKFACVDGPAFDGHEVDFEEQRRRKKFYEEHEEEIEEHHVGGEGCRVQAK